MEEKHNTGGSKLERDGEREGGWESWVTHEECRHSPNQIMSHDGRIVTDSSHINLATEPT